MSVSSFEAPVTSQSAIRTPLETPASIASMPRILAVVGMFSAAIMIDVAAFASNWIEPVLAGIFFVLILVAFFVALFKFATTRVTLTTSDEGIVELRHNAVQARTIAWSSIDEYLCDRDPQGNLSIRLRLKPNGKKLRYTARTAFEKSKRPFEAYAAQLTAKIDLVNEGVDRRSSAPNNASSLLERAPVVTTAAAPLIKKGTSFYDKPIARVIGVVFGTLYALGMIGMLITLNGKVFPYRFLYLGIFLGMYNARVFSKRKKS